MLTDEDIHRAIGDFVVVILKNGDIGWGVLFCKICEPETDRTYFFPGGSLEFKAEDVKLLEIYQPKEVIEAR